jgi:hypothetical protein
LLLVAVVNHTAAKVWGRLEMRMCFAEIAKMESAARNQMGGMSVTRVSIALVRRRRFFLWCGV